MNGPKENLWWMSIESCVSTDDVGLDAKLAKIYLDSPRDYRKLGSFGPKTGKIKVKTPFFDVERFCGRRSDALLAQSRNAANASETVQGAAVLPCSPA